MPRRCAVLGHPIAHSLSPLLHRAAYDALGLDWTYSALDIDEPALAGFVAGLTPPWRGLSLTMPLKRAVLPLLDDVSGLVEQTGAANTVVLEASGRRSGHNTDVAGMVDALADKGVVSVSSALVLGAGATAAAALAALTQLGLTVADVAVRDPARAGPLLAAAQRLAISIRLLRLGDADELSPTDLLVSTLPAAAADAYASVAARCRVVFDVAYDHWPPPLLRAGAVSGRVTASGVDLLVAQAARQVQLMTGLEAPRAAMRAAAHAARPPLAAPHPQGSGEEPGAGGRAH